LLNGSSWEGEFVRGKAVGLGRYISANGEHSDERKFDDNCVIF
jgi:hypothetical protein